MSSNPEIDPDIQAAFSGHTPATLPSPVDDDIAAAFRDTPQDMASKSYVQKGLASLHEGNPVSDWVQKNVAESKFNPMNWPGMALGQAQQHPVAPVFKLPPNAQGPQSQALLKDVQSSQPDVANALINAAGAYYGLKAAFSPLGPSNFLPETSTAARSMGAAQSPISFQSPDLRVAHSQLSPEDIRANEPTLIRHSEADSLPVPMRLTAGQATQDPDIISNEMNKRGATGLSKTLAQQGQQLKDNLQAIRENVGPDVFTTNPVEHGQALIDAYKAKDAPISANTDAKYQALRDGAQKLGIDAPIDGQAFANSARVALRKQLLSNDVPSSVASDLKGFAEGEPMNFEDFESMRTKLAREMRDNPNGNQRTAAGIVRQSLEDLPLQPQAASLKPLADEARSAAKAHFDALRADPAWDAAVNDKVTPDQFVNKFLTGTGGTASKAQATTMRANLANDPTALQTMGVATVDELRKAAGIDSMGNGKFGQSRFNSRLESLNPKINELLPPESVEHARTLGNVARYIKEARKAKRSIGRIRSRVRLLKVRGTSQKAWRTSRPGVSPDR